MKTKLILSISLLCIVSAVTSCKKDHNDDGLSNDIKNFVPQSIIDSMRKWGMTINEGKTPPVINGIYTLSPNYCTFDNSGYNQQGILFSNYKYWFYSQDNKALTVKLNFKSLPSLVDTASGVGAFLSGSNNLFTAFINVSGVSNGISYSRIDFYSGEITSTGISRFQTAFYMKSKGDDPNKKLVAVGSSRIFKDQDEASETSATYRVVMPDGNGKAMMSSQ